MGLEPNKLSLWDVLASIFVRREEVSTHRPFLFPVWLRRMHIEVTDCLSDK